MYCCHLSPSKWPAIKASTICVQRQQQNLPPWPGRSPLCTRIVVGIALGWSNLIIAPPIIHAERRLKPISEMPLQQTILGTLLSQSSSTCRIVPCGAITRSVSARRSIAETVVVVVVVLFLLFTARAARSSRSNFHSLVGGCGCGAG